MCHSVYFSTDSPEQLSSFVSEHFFVAEPDADEPALALLAHPQKWLLRSKFGGCSCHFRHAFFGEFEPSEEWMHEDPENVESTLYAYDFFTKILSDGFALDVVDVWSGDPVDEVEDWSVDLRQVPRDHFLFLSDLRFDFVPFSTV